MNISVALGIQDAMRMSHIVIFGLPRSKYFSKLSHERYDFREKKFIEHKMCVLILSTNLFEIFLILTRNERDVIKNVHWSACKVPFILVQF